MKRTAIEILTVTESTVKLGFSSGIAQDFLKWMKDIPIDLVDLTTNDEEDWINDYETVVFKISPDFRRFAEFASAVGELQPNSTDYIETEEAIYFRLWVDAN